MVHLKDNFQDTSKIINKIKKHDTVCSCKVSIKYLTTLLTHTVEIMSHILEVRFTWRIFVISYEQEIPWSDNKTVQTFYTLLAISCIYADFIQIYLTKIT